MEPCLTAGCTAGSALVPLTHHATFPSASLCHACTTRMQMVGLLGFVLLIVHHSKLLKPFYNLLQSPHFRRSQAVLNTNQCACQEKCNPIYSAQAAKVCLGLVLWHFPSAAGVCTFIDWYGPENTISLSPMILMRMPEVCILRVFKMLQNFVMK